VHQGERLLPKEDLDVSPFIAEVFEAEGICLLHNCAVKSFYRVGNNSFAKIHSARGNDDLKFDVVLLAVGRKANTEGLGLEELGISTTSKGAIEVNDYLQTSYPNIFACGDVAGPYQFTHMAAFQAWFASVNSLFGTFKKFRVNYKVVPWTTFVDPQVARVGLNEIEAQAKGIAYEVTRYAIADLDRAIADSENRGFVKVLTVPGKDKILGATIVGYQAAELLTEFTLAMTHGLGLKKILATIHVYPTLSESNKYAAGAWRRKHAPEWVYPWLEKFHRYRRGA
jgi:pyruvate/2-oxoglutarate dehydrogenase complex dihydrolipoamide dehydrogenase (E3) component